MTPINLLIVLALTYLTVWLVLQLVALTERSRVVLVVASFIVYFVWVFGPLVLRVG